MKETLLLALVIAFANSPAAERLAPLRAYDIGAACLDRENKVSTEICYAFILGVVQTHETFTASPGIAPAFCLPGEITRREAIAAVRKHFRRFTGEAEQPSDVFVTAALAAAYPCP